MQERPLEPDQQSTQPIPPEHSHAPASPPHDPNRRARNKQTLIIIGAAFGALLVIGAIAGALGGHKTPAAAVGSARSAAPAASIPPSSHAPSSPSPKPTTAVPSPSPQDTIASQSVRDKAAAILTTATDHYAQAFAQGQAIVGTTQYADGNAGLDALQDPNSAASKFSAWRQSSKIEQDVMTYQNAFGDADSGFTAADEPASISTWRDDVGNVRADITQWVQTAVSYQISTATQADLDAAAAKVQADLKTARSDVAAVQAGR
jgi:hypothetical protein